MTISHAVVRRILLVFLFGAVSSFGGAVIGIGFDGGGVPHSYLAGSPFDSFVVPGLILGVVIGGTQLVAAVALLRRAASALVFSVVAGFGMIIWIFVELAVISEYSFLQALYFGLGIAELIAVFALLHLAPRLVD